MSDLETQQIEKLKLTWKEINYSIRAKRSKEQKKAEQTTETYYEKCIVDSAEGYCDEGQALFIMGSSGAGKTTLLNILADRIGRPRGSKIERNVKINGEVELNKNNFGAIAAYVMQDDHLFESFTCEQAISFAAKLRLNHRNNEIKDIVDKIIDDLGLKDCRKTKIGGITYKGLSGGERKRTSIAIEIVTNPKILFLDEPTSGLDSFTAKRIVELLIKYSKQNRIVITTIHQPNSEIFILFDRLLLLMEGKTIYQGDAKSSVEYFKNLEFYVPEFCNPTDYYLKEFYVPFIKTEEDILKSEILVRSYNNEILPIIQENMNTDGYYHISNKEIEAMMVKTNWCKEFLILCHRLLINIIQHPKLLKFKILAFLILSLVSLSLFFDLKNDEEGVRSKIGSMLFICNVFTYGPSGSVIVEFSNNRPLLAREYASRTYGLLSYLISSSLMNDLIFESILFCSLFSIIVYFGMGLQAAFSNFLIFTVGLLLMSIVSTSIGLLISAIITNPAAAVSSQGAVLSPFIIFSGIPTNLNTIYIWLRWVQYLSPMRYVMEILVRNEFSGSNDSIINSLGYDLGIANCMIILICMIIVFRVLATIFLKLSLKSI